MMFCPWDQYLVEPCACVIYPVNHAQLKIQELTSSVYFMWLYVSFKKVKYKQLTDYSCFWTLLCQKNSTAKINSHHPFPQPFSLLPFSLACIYLGHQPSCCTLVKLSKLVLTMSCQFLFPCFLLGFCCCCFSVSLLLSSFKTGIYFKLFVCHSFEFSFPF